MTFASASSLPMSDPTTTLAPAMRTTLNRAARAWAYYQAGGDKKAARVCYLAAYGRITIGGNETDRVEWRGNMLDRAACLALVTSGAL